VAQAVALSNNFVIVLLYLTALFSCRIKDPLMRIQWLSLVPHKLPTHFDDEKSYTETVTEGEMFSWDQLVEDEDDNSTDDGMDELVIDFN
jgi:hypothetical protein